MGRKERGCAQKGGGQEEAVDAGADNEEVVLLLLASGSLGWWSGDRSSVVSNGSGGSGTGRVGDVEGRSHCWGSGNGVEDKQGSGGITSVRD